MGLLDITGLWLSSNGAEHYELSLKLLFSINSQTIVATGLFVAFISITCGSATQSITLIPLKCGSTTLWEMCVRHLCNSVTVAFRATRILSTVGVLLTVALRATKIPTTLRADVPVAIRATKNLEDTMLPVNYWSWRRSFSELPILSTVRVNIPVDYSFQSYEMLSTVGVDIPADRSFQSYQIPDNFKSWRSCSYQSYQKPGRHYASRQLSELTT